MSKDLRNTIASSIAAYVEVIFGLVISIILARGMGRDQYGLYSYYIWLIALFVILTNNGITTAAIKFTAESNSREKLERYTNALVQYLEKIQFRSILVVLLIAFLMFYYQTREIFLTGVLLISVVLRSRYMLHLSLIKGYESFGMISKLMAIISPLNLLLVTGVYYLFNELDYYIYTFAAISFLYYFISHTFTNKLASKTEIITIIREGDKSRIKSHIAYTSVISIMSFIVIRQSEIFFLKMYAPVEQVAFFNIGFMISLMSASLVPGVYSNILLPITSKIDKNNKIEHAKKLLSSIHYLLLLAMPLIVFIFVFSSNVIVALYGTNYREAGEVLKYLIIASSLLVVSHSATSFLMGSDRQKVYLVILLSTGIVTILIDYFLIKKYFLTGAIIAYTSSSAILVAALFIKTRIILKLKYEFVLYLKILLSAVAPILILKLANHSEVSILYLAIYGVIYLVMYLVVSLFVGCWPKEVKEYLHTRFSSSRN